MRRFFSLLAVEKMSCKFLHYFNIDCVPKLLISLLPVVVWDERVRKTLQARTFSGRKKTSPRPYYRCLDNCYKCRKICVYLNSYARWTQLEYMLPNVGGVRLSCLPFKFRLCPEKERTLLGFKQPFVNEIFVVQIQFVILQYEILFPCWMLRKVFRRVKFCKTVRPHRKTG